MSAEPKPWEFMSAVEKGDAVKDLILVGTSYVEIARKLQAPDRNCVAGVVNRMRKAGKLPPARTRQQTGADGGAMMKIKARVAKAAKVPNAAQGKARSPNPKPTKRLVKTADGIVGAPMRGPNNPHSYDFKARAELRAASPGIEIRRAAAFDPIAGITPIGLFDLKSTTCRWPVNGLEGRDDRFCGASCEIERTYCEAHRRLAYLPPKVRTNRHHAVVKAAERISS